MILTAESDQRIIKSFHNIEPGQYGFHKIFGFIGEKASQQRMKSRKRRGIQFSEDCWKYKFEVIKDKVSKQLKLQAIEGCELEKIDENQWKIKTKSGNFLLSQSATPIIPGIYLEDHTEDDRLVLPKSLASALSLVFVFVTGLWLMTPEVSEEEKPEEEQIEVKIKEQKVVKINIVPAKKVSKEEIKKRRAHRAVMASLSFTGLVGDKSLKDAVGGAPTELQKVTAGAGPGGDAGSGGEVISNLGKGVKKITVGNTGTKGLGGVGTKGRGGGKGGYGDAIVAAGEGKGISSVPIAKDITIDGGLDKYTINAAMAKYRRQIQACYERELGKNPSLIGEISLNFVIQGNGRLKNTFVKDLNLSNRATVNCIAGLMPSWRFPKPRGGVNVPVNMPFMLEPSKVKL